VVERDDDNAHAQKREKACQEILHSRFVIGLVAHPCSLEYALGDLSERDTKADRVGEKTVNEADEDAEDKA